MIVKKKPQTRFSTYNVNHSYTMHPNLGGAHPQTLPHLSGTLGSCRFSWAAISTNPAGRGGGDSFTLSLSLSGTADTDRCGVCTGQTKRGSIMKIFLGSFFTGKKKVVRSLHLLARFQSATEGNVVVDVLYK